MIKRSKSYVSGIRLMIQASFFFSLMALCVKAVSRSLPSNEIVFFRSLLGLLMILPLMKAKKVSFWGRHRGKLFLRGIAGYLALALFFHTIGRLPLGTAVLLNYTSPLFTVLLSYLLLKEKMNMKLIALIALTFTGVYLLVNGSLPHWDTAILTGLLSAFFAAAAYVTIRAIRHRESPLTVIFYFTGVSTVCSAALAVPHFRWPGAVDWLYLLGIGFFAFWAQIWMTIALRRAPASLLSPFSYLTPLLSFIYGLLFWHETLNARTLCGALLIIAGGTLISHYGTLKKGVTP